MRYRIVFLAGLGAGFVLGARAGRERYEQIKAAVRRTMDTPAVQHAADSVGEHAGHLAQSATHAAVESGKNVADKVTGHLPPHLPERLRGAAGSRLRHPSARGSFLTHRGGHRKHTGDEAPEADGLAFGVGEDHHSPNGAHEAADGPHNGFDRS